VTAPDQLGLAAPAARPGARTAQRVFRAVLAALSRPGLGQLLPDVEGLPAALLPLLTLADLDTGVCVLGHPDGPEPAAATFPTSAPAVPLAEARMVAALRPVTAAELGAVRVGSAAAPEEGALVTLAVPALTGGPPLRLDGPGVPPSGRPFGVAGLPAGWLDVRAAPTFPAGADLLFVDPAGRCVGLPRSTRVGV
jgi:alpha-D-ribose 1-methylphosphonate 5-triphosphate synthase subunit PhnH